MVTKKINKIAIAMLLFTLRFFNSWVITDRVFAITQRTQMVILLPTSRLQVPRYFAMTRKLKVSSENIISEHRVYSGESMRTVYHTLLFLEKTTFHNIQCQVFVISDCEDRHNKIFKSLRQTTQNSHRDLFFFNRSIHRFQVCC